MICTAVTGQEPDLTDYHKQAWLTRTENYRGKYWTGLRAACEPVFHSDKLQSYVPITNTALTSLIDKLEGIQAKGPVEINLALAGMTMAVIGASAFG